MARVALTTSVDRWYAGRRILLTGHTGFKGAWLAAWLRDAGAEVTGLSLAPDGDGSSLYESAAVGTGLRSVIGDIRDAGLVSHVTREAAPEIVFHLAAQSLVRRSYREPIETMATNVLGTAHVLDAVRNVPSIRAVVVVTSDKCYENDGTGAPLLESAPMGGHDPYSASKGCAELVTAAWRRSFLADAGVAVASARAGNVFGGGDRAEDRLIPDLVRAAERGESALLRNPEAVRPWQYVLEPLHGYLMLARELVEQGAVFAEGWNFGPRLADALPVRDVAARLAREWPAVRVGEATAPPALHEAPTLALDASKAGSHLGWRPVLALDEAIVVTAAWYRDASHDPAAVPALLARDLAHFRQRIAAATDSPTRHGA